MVPGVTGVVIQVVIPDPRAPVLPLALRRRLEELLRDQWCLRDWVGFDSKRLHRNQRLVDILFEEWLQLDSSLVGRVKEQAKATVTQMAEELAAKQQRLGKKLRAQGVDMRALDGDP